MATDVTIPDSPETSQFWHQANAIWPDLTNQQAVIAPARNGMDRTTGKLLQGWSHVEQSMELIFATPFHQRVLRRWVGSFVPLILGESGVSRVITRFFWAIGSALDLWEPDYRIKQVFFMGDALSTYSPPLGSGATATLYRAGDLTFRTEGQYFPRAHLGDRTPYTQKLVAVVGRGSMWDVVPVG
jgi:hypothetical protein